MKATDYHGTKWNVYLEDWGLAGIPKDQYRLQKGIMDVFIPIRIMEDEWRGRNIYILEMYAVEKWRQVGRHSYKPIKSITKYYVDNIVKEIGSQVRHVNEAIMSGKVKQANMWISLVNYD